jgi:hypothetical protein
MDTKDNSMLLMRYWIRDEFTSKVAEICNMKARQCRGGSTSLYKLILKSPATYQYLLTDKDHLQIVSGMGHTFIRYQDDENDRYIYIDPTIAQFVPFDGIFVGTGAELKALANAQGSRLDITDYIEDPSWTRKSVPPLKVEYEMMAGAIGGRKTRKVRNIRVNKTRKVKNISIDTLHKLTHKYGVTKSGSEKQIALRLWKLERHVMSLRDLKIIEDFLNLAPSKRYKGARYGRRKSGTLYCISGKCEQEDLN